MKLLKRLISWIISLFKAKPQLSDQEQAIESRITIPRTKKGAPMPIGKRPEGMDYETYREIRAESNRQLRRYLKGTRIYEGETVYNAKSGRYGQRPLVGSVSNLMIQGT